MTMRVGLAGRVLATALTAGLAVGLAGCGNEQRGAGYAGSESGGIAYAEPALTKDQIIRTTYDAAMEAGSAHVSMKMSGKASLKAKGDVAYGRRTSTMAMTMAMPQLGKRKILMRYVGGIVYMQIPGITPPGKFLAIDPADKKSPLAKSFAGTTDQMDPLSSMKSMESAVKTADRVGKGTVQGAPVEHYRLTVDTAAMVEELGAAAKQAALPDTLIYDMWLDRKDLIRRMAFSAAGTSVEMVLSHWGRPVNVRRPAPGAVATFPRP